jgi:hypothetical protein
LQKEMQKYPAVVRVFQQEGRAVASIDHENVVKIYDVGEDQGQHYLVLELLKGTDLRKQIDAAGESGLSVDVALEYTRQAAAGLAAAGRKNLVHRDVKPQNIVIEPDGTAKIVDFGLAAEAEGAFAGGRLGTPHYMAPEVCRGEQAQTASDVYSLGITLYHMLIGKPPFHGRKSTEEIIQDHLKGERLQPERHRPDLPSPVGDLVRRMTRQDPAARPTAADVATLVSEKLTPEKLGARGGARGRRGGGARGRPAKSSNAIWMGVGAAAVVAILAFVLMSSRGSSSADGGSGAIAGAGGATAAAGAGNAKPDKADKPEKTAAKPKETEEGSADLEEMFAIAEREEKTGNLMEAHHLYQRVFANAPNGSRLSRLAKASAETVKDLIDEKRGVVPRRKYIGVRASREAGEEFAAKRGEVLRRLGEFDVTAVKKELEEFAGKMRSGTDEQVSVEEAQRLVAYMESLASLLSVRAGSLDGDKAYWYTYDVDADEDLVIGGAGENGVTLRNLQTDVETVIPWKDVAIPMRVGLLEAIRNPRNATETLWVGFYCRLVGADEAERYFEMALVIDSSPDIKALAAELKGEK